MLKLEGNIHNWIYTEWNMTFIQFAITNAMICYVKCLVQLIERNIIIRRELLLGRNTYVIWFYIVVLNCYKLIHANLFLMTSRFCLVRKVFYILCFLEQLQLCQTAIECINNSLTRQAGYLSLTEQTTKSRQSKEDMVASWCYQYLVFCLSVLLFHT